jgi:dihydropteroate synthase
MVQYVGIVNVTPDSFSDGGKFLESDDALKQIKQLFDDGAAIVDIGAESTRPHAEVLTDEQEWQRLEPILSKALPLYPGHISLDSYHLATIEKAFNIAPVIINDVTGFQDIKLQDFAAQHHATVVISHLPTGMTIKQAHEAATMNDIQQVKDQLLATAKRLEEKGLERQHIILDPGIGFGKTPELNQELLTFAAHVPQYPVMIGHSRKRFLGESRMELAPNIEAAKIAIKSGAVYLRVHDVAGHKKEIT